MAFTFNTARREARLQAAAPETLAAECASMERAADILAMSERLGLVDAGGAAIQRELLDWRVDTFNRTLAQRPDIKVEPMDSAALYAEAAQHALERERAAEELVRQGAPHFRQLVNFKDPDAIDRDPHAMQPLVRDSNGTLLLVQSPDLPENQAYVFPSSEFAGQWSATHTQKWQSVFDMQDPKNAPLLLHPALAERQGKEWVVIEKGRLASEDERVLERQPIALAPHENRPVENRPVETGVFEPAETEAVFADGRQPGEPGQSETVTAELVPEPSLVTAELVPDEGKVDVNLVSLLSSQEQSIRDEWLSDLQAGRLSRHALDSYFAGRVDQHNALIEMTVAAHPELHETLPPPIPYGALREEVQRQANKQSIAGPQEDLTSLYQRRELTIAGLQQQQVETLQAIIRQAREQRVSIQSEQHSLGIAV